jgi:molybdate transport system substrate-binding protein
MRYIARYVAMISLVLLVEGCAGAAQVSPAEPSDATVVPRVAATAPASPRATLSVLASASFRGVFKEIGKRFETANPDTSVIFTFDNGMKLAQQIRQGAAADVFAAIAARQLDPVVQSGQISSGTPIIFAHDRLVVIAPRRRTAAVAALADLARPGVRLIMAPSTTPAGQSTLDFLARASADPALGASFKADVLKHVIAYEEQPRAIPGKVLQGPADAAVVYSSDVAPELADQLTIIDIPDTLNPVLAYAVAPVKASGNARLAQMFAAYLLSPEAQATLTRYGFIAVDATAASR